MGEHLNDDLREQGHAVWETKLQCRGCPFEVTLHKKKKEKEILSLRVGVFAHVLLCV